MSFPQPETEQRNIHCKCCGEPIVGVFKSELPDNLAYADKWDNDLVGLVCDECHNRLKLAGAWIKHGTNIKGCTKDHGGRGAV